MPKTIDSWIDGGPSVSSSAARRICMDPGVGLETVSVPDGSAEDVDRAVAAAKKALFAWRHMPALDRGRLLHAVAQGIRGHVKVLAKAEREDTGKPEALTAWEIENSATYFEYYAALVHLPVGDVLDTTPGEHTFTRREPFGVVGIITPWNLPLNQAARACAPALAAGNTLVLKPAQNTPQTSLILAEIMAKAGIPAGVFNVLLGAGSKVGDALVGHQDVAKVAFTGSVEVGQHIGAVAAQKIIPLTLELGGKSANIVFPDADLELAASEAVRAFVTNTGQVCSSGTRLLVHEEIYEDFVNRVADITTGHVPELNLGPMITRDQFDQVHHYLTVAEKEGAVPIVGGVAANKTRSGPGLYVEPTVYANVTNTMTIAREEVFGPVLSAISFSDAEEAIALANDSDFGLVAGVWTKDIGMALRVSSALQAGQVFVNTWSTGSVATPFGGYKQSGYGREKGIEGLLSYTQLKSVVVKY